MGSQKSKERGMSPKLNETRLLRPHPGSVA
jgi:hypothetical protein